MNSLLTIAPRLSCLAAALLQVACAPQPVADLPDAAACGGAMAIGQVVAIEAGFVQRGNAAFQPEERVGGQGRVTEFDIDATEVTNAQFARFVADTGYITVAERRDATGATLGAAVFDRGSGAWRIDSEANWRQPQGAGSKARDDAPVVAVAYEDAESYATWLGRSLPSELQWEYAARGASTASADIEAERRDATGQWLANSWQGSFPQSDQAADGYAGVAPVGCYPPNSFGLYDMVGNVWEWTRDWYAPNVAPASFDESRATDREGSGKRVIKGGSHLCADNFCSRYRSGSRQPADFELGTSHIGFRTVSSRSRED